ncbi:MAG: histidine kinase [Bacteroidetes bacterium]|nr:histidine kinase [Bacteroidota bacterium]
MYSEATNTVVIYYLVGTLFVAMLVFAMISYILLHQKRVTDFRLQITNAIKESEDRERTRLALELHDGIGAKLSGLKMNLEYIMISDGVHEHAALIEKTFSGIDETIVELREISQNLKLSITNEEGLQSSVEKYLNQLNRHNKCVYNLSFEIKSGDLPEMLIMPVYRIIMELVHNIHKHSRADAASIQIDKFDDKIQLIIEDNGIGFNEHTVSSTGIGLDNVRRRIEVFKGFLHIDSHPGGTTIIIEFPSK